MEVIKVNGDKVFKYISCYGLSKDFNYALDAVLKFKYISCYGLSEHGFEITLMEAEFKYISCYGLSYILLCIYLMPYHI